jgi:hypothetical protein
MKFRVGAILAGAALMVAAASPTYAQGVTFGAKVGVNFADISASGDDDPEEVDFEMGNKIGFVAGGFVEVPFAPQFSFSPEVLFTQKGSKGDMEFAGDEYTASLNVTQVQIPLLFKANFSTSSVRPFVVVGPAFGFTAKANSKLELNGDDFDEEDLKDDVESVEFSLVFGGGVRFGNATVEARYDLGLNDLNKQDLVEGKTRTFSILFGFGWSN